MLAHVDVDEDVDAREDEGLARDARVYYVNAVTGEEPKPDKKDVARALLVRGSVFVYLDPRRDAVRVPPWLARQPQLVLQFGLDLPVPIPDMRVDDGGVFGTLSFNRQPFACAVPWDAVFALVGDDGMGMVWEEDLPEEIAEEVEAGFKKKTEAPPERPSLRAIDGGLSNAPPAPEPEPPSDELETATDELEASHDDPPDGDEPDGDGSARDRAPHLRVIK